MPLTLPVAPTRRFNEFTPLPDLLSEKKIAYLRLASENAGRTLAIVIQYFRNGNPDRSFTRPQEICRLAGDVASKSVSFASIPTEGTDIWSKCSWAVFKHRVEEDEIDKTLRLRLVGDPPPGTDLVIKAMWLQ